MDADVLTAPLVTVEDLTVRLRRRTVLDGITLSLGPGVHGLLGPNGAGKTTLIRVLATVIAATGGSVRLLPDPAGGNPPPLREIRRRLGYLPQQFGFYPRLTAREYVEYLAWLKEMPPAGVPLAVDRALARVGLTDRADHRLKTLSGGMIRRVGIAQALVNDPAVLLLDEPTAGLDPEQRLFFRSLVREVGQDTCVLISTHLVEDVAAACDDVRLMDAGRIVFTGSPADLAGLAPTPAPASDESDALGHRDGSPLERGYLAALAAGRADRAFRTGRMTRMSR